MSLLPLITVSHRLWQMIAVYLCERRLLSFVMSTAVRNRDLLRLRCGVSYCQPHQTIAVGTSSWEFALLRVCTI